ncbi:alkaline phosphatase, partial [Aliivibrio sp. A6]|nr:alkaline phosphatase [Aliivibrio sp. A6]
LGVMVYDVTEPKSSRFVTYVNNRNFDVGVCTQVDEEGECKNGSYNPNAGDLGPESIKYFTRLNQHFIAVANEVSGTTSVYRIDF